MWVYPSHLPRAENMDLIENNMDYTKCGITYAEEQIPNGEFCVTSTLYRAISKFPDI